LPHSFNPGTRFALALHRKEGFFGGPALYGGTQNDASARFRWRLRPDLIADAFVQYERWLIPSVRTGIQHDVTGQFRLTFNPHLELHHN